jgi:hypothetical protein
MIEAREGPGTQCLHHAPSSRDVQKRGQVVIHISLVLAFDQVAMQLDWNDAGLGKSLTESRNYASMSGKGEPYTEQECFSYVKHGIVCTRYGKVVEPGIR